MSDMVNKSPNRGPDQGAGEQTDSPGILAPREAAICPAGITTRSLRLYFLSLEQGLAIDNSLAEHLKSGCAACEARRLRLYATVPGLQEGVETAPAHVEHIFAEAPTASTADRTGLGLDPEISSTEGAKNSQVQLLRVELARKLASLMATPAQPLGLAELRDMDRSVRQPADPAQRLNLVRRINELCEKRWRRLPAEIRADIEGAAAQLQTALRRQSPDNPPVTEDNSEAGSHDTWAVPEELSSDNSQRAFLVYMMSASWFLNAEGESPWTIKETAGGPRVVVLLDVLRRALLCAPGQS